MNEQGGILSGHLACRKCFRRRGTGFQPVKTRQGLPLYVVDRGPRMFTRRSWFYRRRVVIGGCSLQDLGGDS